MQQTKMTLSSLKLIGITARTNNKSEFNPETAKIGKLSSMYWSQQIANQFKHRVNPGVTYCVYTEYETDEHSDYTYFIGEQVGSLEDQSKFQTLIIPAGPYQKFTTDPGKMPQVIIAAWQDIWQMKEKDFGGKRSYRADFELYDERAGDPNHSVVDVYIGIK